MHYTESNVSSKTLTELKAIADGLGLTYDDDVTEEDQVIGEGKIYFDIRFSVYLGAELIKILINIEKELEKMGY